MNHLEERVLMEAEKRKDELFAQLSKLIAVNTENFSTTGNEKNGQPCVAEMFEGLGLAADTFSPESLPGFSEHEAYFPGRHLEDRPDVCAVWPGREGRHRVMLAAHVDTVPIGDESQWTVPPLGGMIRDGRIWGRGASDDKAGIAVSWFAVHVLQACGVQLKDDVVLTSYSDEEGGGSHGALAAALKYPCNVYVNLDGGNMCLFTHGTGGGCFQIKFMKRMPTETALPVFKAVEAFCHALEPFGQRRREELESNPVFAGSSTAAQAFRLFHVTVGGTGGTDLNIGSVDFAFYSLKSRKDAEAELEALIEEIRPELDRLDVDAGEFIHTTRYFLPVMPDEIGPAAKLFAGCLEELRGVPTENQGMCLSDAPMFYHYGNGEVFSFCTGNRFGEYGGAHQPDEYVTCDNLLTVAKGVLLFLLRHSL